MKEKDLLKLGQELINCGFITKAQSSSKPASSGSGKEKKSRPDRLQASPTKTFDKDGYYVIDYQGDSTWQYILLGCIIVGVLLVCMWPVWPLWAKIGIWYLSVIFLSLYFGVLILRAVVYTCFWVVGFDFWIFPNLTDDYAGFIDSFKPLYSLDKRQDDLIMLLVRFGSLAIVAVAVEQISHTCSLTDFTELVTHSYTDLLDWGVDKIMALPGSQREALPSVEELTNLAEEEGKEGNASEPVKNAESVAPGANDDDDDGPETVLD
jgi:translocation protein SEC62